MRRQQQELKVVVEFAPDEQREEGHRLLHRVLQWLLTRKDKSKEAV